MDGATHSFLHKPSRCMQGQSYINTFSGMLDLLSTECWWDSTFQYYAFAITLCFNKFTPGVAANNGALPPAKLLRYDVYTRSWCKSQAQVQSHLNLIWAHCTVPSCDKVCLLFKHLCSLQKGTSNNSAHVSAKRFNDGCAADVSSGSKSMPRDGPSVKLNIPLCSAQQCTTFMYFYSNQIGI